jgi:hypothetical protein
MPTPQDAVILITILEPLFWRIPKQLHLGEDLTSHNYQSKLEIGLFCVSRITILYSSLFTL